MRKNSSSNLFISAIFLLLLFATCSCHITRNMWTHGYTDRVKNFLVGNDGKYIAFIGNDYHYVLVDNSNILKDILAWKMRGLLTINTEKTNLKIDKKNNISGEVFIEAVNSNLPRTILTFLQGIGFRMDEKNNVLFLKIRADGKRYLADPRNNLSKATNLPSLTLPYKIFIKEDTSTAEKIRMAALTPITMTLDGVISIGKVILFPFSSN